MGTRNVILLVTMLVATGLAEGTWMRDSATHIAVPDGYHAYLIACITFYLSCVLCSLFRDCSSSSGRPTDSAVNLIMMSSLIGSSWGWQIPESQRALDQMAMGPEVKATGLMRCLEDSCQVDISVEGRLQIKEGHVLRFDIIEQETGDKVPGVLSVNFSETYIGYTADVVMPYYDMVYGTFLSNDKEADYEKWTVPLQDNSSLRSKLQTHAAEPLLVADHVGTFYPTEVVERTYGTLADKFKCGVWGTDDLKVKQVYSINPYKTGGYVQWIAGRDYGLNVTICLELNGNLCFNGVFKADEEIAFEHPDFTIKVAQKHKPSSPFTPPLLAKYNVINETHVALSDWRVMHRPIRGNHAYGDIGAVQTTCVWTKTSICPVGAYQLSQMFDWNMSSETQCGPQRSIIALIIALIAAACIAAAVVGGVAGAASCKKCGFITKSITAPDYQNKLASEYAGIDTVYPNLVKRLPDTVSLATKEGQKFFPVITLKLENFEEQHLQMSVDGTDVAMVIPESLSKVISWDVPSCRINLAGGVSDCEFRAQFNGPDTEVPLYTKEADNYPVTTSVYLRQGMNTGTIGVQVSNRAEIRPNVCIGRRRESKCSTAKTIEYITNPDSVTVDVDTGETYVGGGTTWNFKSFWNALSEWWQKLIAILTWIVGVVLFIVLIIVIWRVSKWLIWMIGMRGTKASAQHEAKAPVKLWRAAGSDMLTSYNHNFTDGMEEIFIMASMLPDVTIAEFRKWVIIPNNTWTILTGKTTTWNGLCKSCSKYKYQSSPYTEVTYSRAIIRKSPYVHPVCHICEFQSSTTKFRSTPPITKPHWTQVVCNAPGREAQWPSHYGTCQGPVVPISQECSVYSNFWTDTKGSPQCRGELEGFLTPVCLEEVVPEAESQICPGSFKTQDECDIEPDFLRYKCVEPKCDFYGMNSRTVDEETMIAYMTDHWGTLWFQEAINLDHINNKGILHYRMFIRDNTVVFNAKEVEIPKEDKDVYGILIHAFPLKTCRGCPVVLIFKAMNTQGIAHPFTEQMWMKMAIELTSLSGDYRAHSIESRGDLTILTLTCDRCELQIHGKLITVTNSKSIPVGKCLNIKHNAVSDAMAGGPLLGPCVCFGPKEVWCMDESGIAVFEAECQPWLTVDGAQLNEYSGGYRCGIGGPLNYEQGYVRATRDSLMSVDGWSSAIFHKAGDRVVLRGPIELAGDRPYYYTIYAASSSTCKPGTWDCIYGEHKGVFWISVGVPLLFLLIILIMLIVKMCVKYNCGRKMRNALRSPQKMADMVINMETGQEMKKGNGMRLRRV